MKRKRSIFVWLIIITLIFDLFLHYIYLSKKDVYYYYIIIYNNKIEYLLNLYKKKNINN